MWIKLTRKNDAKEKILVNTDNVCCVLTGHNLLYDGDTLVIFSGDKENFISVEESIDKVEEILRSGIEGGENIVVY